MNIVIWLVFGLLIGIIAHLISPRTDSTAALGTIILGTVGSLVGGSLAFLFFGSQISGFHLLSFSIAALGAVLLLYLEKEFRTIS